MIRKNIFMSLIVLSVISGTVMVAHSGYFYAKGLLVQFLLNNAWEQSKRSGHVAKPWSWANTFPVAKLTIHSIGLSAAVLRDTTGESLSYGPAHVPGSARPGSHGNIAIAGHRDSFFRNLGLVQRGAVIGLESLSTVQHFEVTSIDIAGPEDTRWIENSGDNIITLITCYPFNYIGPAPKRYVVRGQLIEKVHYQNSRG